MDSSQFNVDNAVEAFGIVGQNKSSKETFKQAEHYLVALEKSEIGWQILLNILEDSKFPSEIHHQAVLMLKHKLQFDFHQLPEDEYLNLTECIFSKAIC